MAPARPVPSAPPGGLPLSVLLDFDGTISPTDVGDALLARHVADRALVARIDALYDEGRMGSRDLLRWDLDALPRDAALLRREALAFPLDEGLAEIVALAREVGAAIEVVSDGLGFHVQAMLDAAGFGDLPVATNAARLGEGGAGLSFPYGHPDCFVCGTCKRERVRAHQSCGRTVAFVGDGTSDRYAAHHADLVFARAGLAAWCVRVGIDFEPWDRLSDVADGLRDLTAKGSLQPTMDGFPGTEGQVGDPRHRKGPRRAFICGPEAEKGDPSTGTL